MKKLAALLFLSSSFIFGALNYTTENVVAAEANLSNANWEKSKAQLIKILMDKKLRLLLMQIISE